MLRLSCLFACLLLSFYAHAAEQQAASSIAAVPSGDQPKMLVKEQPKVVPVKVAPLPGEPSVSVTIPAPTPPAMDSDQEPLPLDSGDRQLLQRKQAQKKIGLLRATVKATEVHKGFFSGLFSTPERPIDKELLAETGRFIELYPGLPDTPEVYQLRAQVHQRIEDYRGAAVDWLVSLAAHPDSAFAFEARNGLQQLANEKLKDDAKTVRAMMEQLNKLSGGREQRVADLLVFMGAQQDKKFAPIVIAECNSFLMRNRDYPHQDRIIDALAHQQALLDAQSAIYHFNELTALYPNSPLLPDSMLSIGNIQRTGLKHYDDAALSYKAVIAKFPDSKETGQAYEALADMYDQDMHDYSNALKTYDAIVARYKDEPLVRRSLQAEATIYQNKTNQPLEAIAAYRKLANTFKGKEGLAALLQAEKLARYTVGDWKLSIEINRHIVNTYPDDPEAAKAMYANASIYDEKLKDRVQALNLYQQFVAHYPSHDLAGQARQRIKALQQQQQQKQQPKPK